MSVGPFASGKAILNTLVRLLPIALYSGSSISALLFGDFRGTLLFVGFIINEAIAYGYRLILNGVYNPQCALLKTEEDYFVLPSPISQTIGFFFGFFMSEMYSQGAFYPSRFFVLLVVLILTIISRVNVGCKSFLDALYCAFLGILLGVGWFNIVKEYYRRDFYKLDESSNVLSEFLKLE